MTIQYISDDGKIFYDEYDCGGEISSYTSKIPDDISLYDSSFIIWLRSEIEDCI